jgi:hypothetical protein
MVVDGEGDDPEIIVSSPQSGRERNNARTIQ